MIDPALIASPPNTLTPSRFACESRPLRDEPPAFLCAIVILATRRTQTGAPAGCFSVDCVDAQFGEVLPVTSVLLKVLAPAHLEDSQFVVPAMRKHGGGHRGARHQRRADAHVGTIANRKHLGQRHHAADFRADGFDAYLFAGDDAILLAARLDHCIHGLLHSAGLRNRSLLSYCRCFLLLRLPSEVAARGWGRFGKPSIIPSIAPESQTRGRTAGSSGVRTYNSLAAPGRKPDPTQDDEPTRHHSTCPAERCP